MNKDLLDFACMLQIIPHNGGMQGPVSCPGSGQGSPLCHSDVLVSGTFGCTQSTEMKYDITEGADKLA